MQDTQTDSRVSDIAGRPTCGTLYGLGVGPGSPDLLTIRAVKVLQSVSVILAAASPKNDDSLALSIAAPHLPPGCETVRLDFPMTRDTTLLHQAWEQNAQKVASLLKKGKSAAFLTLGDPLIYSTFGYLMRTLRKTMPGLPIEIVPGITSYQAAAARTQTILCEGEENLLLLSGIANGERLELLLRQCDSAAILKTYRNIEAILQAVDKAERGEDCIFASRLGLEGEQCGQGLEEIPAKPHYLSLLLLPPKRRETDD